MAAFHSINTHKQFGATDMRISSQFSPKRYRLIFHDYTTIFVVVVGLLFAQISINAYLFVYREQNEKRYTHTNNTAYAWYSNVFRLFIICSKDVKFKCFSCFCCWRYYYMVHMIVLLLLSCNIYNKRHTQIKYEYRNNGLIWSNKNMEPLAHILSTNCTQFASRANAPCYKWHLCSHFDSSVWRICWLPLFVEGLWRWSRCF